MPLSTRNGWKEKAFLFFHLALLTQCQHHHHHPHNHQIVPLSTHPISPASVDRRATQGLAAVQRFREILRIQDNQNHGINRFPQSSPNPLPPPSSPLPSPSRQRNPLDGGSEPSGIPEISRPQETGLTSISPPKDLGSQPNVQTFGLNRTQMNSFSEHNKSEELNSQQTVTTNDFASNFQDSGPSQDDIRTPEVARVPEIPEHLPIDLVNRLQEFPSLVSSFDESPAPATLHAFFEPTQEVRAEELTDEEWHQYLENEWGSHGVVPSLVTTPPKYVANVNYGGHFCLHLGNILTPAQAGHKPKSFEFPGEANRQYTVMLLDMDHSTGVYINWISINVPLNQMNKGTDIIEYEQPKPGQTSGVHRMVFLVYLQKAALTSKVPSLPSAKACEIFNRERADLGQLTSDLGLEGPLAGNYFLTEWDITVEHACREGS